MHFRSVHIPVCAILARGCGGAPLASAGLSNDASRTVPLILERDEGERRVWRAEDFQAHFILKVDPRNGGSRHLVLVTEDLAPGETIPSHRQPGADEILFLRTGTSRERGRPGILRQAKP
jgi:hypothetical protein